LTHFADRLRSAVRDKRTALVVGIDPRIEMLPEPFRNEVAAATDKLQAAADAFETFGREVIDAVEPHCIAVKPQSAFFEALGPSGMTAYENVSRYARSNGLLVIGDVKRGDIGATCEAYAAAYLGGAAFEGGALRRPPFDAVTVNPYLGGDGVEPFVRSATDSGKGVFVLVKTSNPSSKEFQDVVAEGRPMYERVAEAVKRWGADTLGECGYSNVGAVVGATWPRELGRLRELMPKTIFLAPGLGAQGGKVADIMPAFDKDGFGALAVSARAIIFACHGEPYRTSFGEARWRDACAAAAETVTVALRKGLGL